MKSILTAILLLLCSNISADILDDYAEKIDRVIDENLSQNSIPKAKIISDEVFVRRVYLDAVGRIPTAKEFLSFTEDQSIDKRKLLADRLLNSEGYNSGIYSFYADLLRLRFTRQSGLSYINWVKKEIAANTPWDKFVKKMILARGNISTSPAAGFYLRDRGMPFSQMSNTVQAFLGTRLQCAQCHDHPFDKWTQKNFFELTAFTYPVDFKGGANEYNKTVDINALKKAGLKLGGPPLQVLRRNLDFGAFVTDKRKLQYPHDYKYDDAKPNEKVKPTIPFSSEQPDPKSNSSDKLTKFADWLTSKDNELFTKVIANRLWKKYMGQGVFEPLDNFSDKTVISNKELMSILEETMIICNYDIKKFQSVIIRTKAYQRAARDNASQTFNGTQLRRMTAEQIWDSFATLLVEKVDDRPIVNYPLLRLFYMDALDVARSRELTQASQRKYEHVITEANRKYTEFFKEDGELRKRISASKDRSLKKKLTQEAKELKKKLFREISEMVIGTDLRSVQDKLNSRYIVSTIANKLKLDYIDLREDPGFWKNYRNDMVRASRSGFPVKDSHILRLFGSSDYNTLGGNSTISTVTQALYMLNGLNSFRGSNWYLGQELNRLKTPEEKITAIFISTLTRKPSVKEMNACLKVLNSDKNNGIRTIVKGLLNTKTFLFY